MIFTYAQIKSKMYQIYDRKHDPVLCRLQGKLEMGLVNT